MPDKKGAALLTDALFSFSGEGKKSISLHIGSVFIVDDFCCQKKELLTEMQLTKYENRIISHKIVGQENAVA